VAAEAKGSRQLRVRVLDWMNRADLPRVSGEPD
jgi:hypothetical protein